MKIIFISLIGILILENVYGWVANEPADDGQGGCKSKNPAVGTLKSGEVKYLDNVCVTAECQSNGNIHYQGCGYMAKVHESDCQVSTAGKRYPDCCKASDCDNKPAADAKSS
ncbi:hypothetical protein ILUMI_11795 [Ignelater luminosus]|uniref:Single domain-containing protein n=1 Tax=Ignelater luminosus TaxID=2038154 RepID=A0A8K0D1I4_IGNLU|nr:hypothetical protein ILUMI_11795 [Ignelater luminosus]